MSVSVSGSGSRSLGVPRPNVDNTPAPLATNVAAPATPAPVAAEPVLQESLSEQKTLLVKSIIDQSLLSPDDNEVAEEIKLRFKQEHHSAIVTAILNIALEKFVLNNCFSLLLKYT